MINKSLEGIVSKPYHIFAIPDLHNYPLWLQRLEENLPGFQKVFTSVEYEWEYFISRGYEVSDLPMIPDISGTMLRAMLNNREDITSFIPSGTQQVLERIGGAERVRQLYEKDLSEVIDGKLISLDCS
jgi:nicotinamide mononucleotide adenylyltransferase